MRDGKSTKSRLLIEAFKLFALKPYDRVTFADLEEATGLSRGAILYHIKSKENLFMDVVKSFIFERNSVLSIPETCRQSLNLFISEFVLSCQKEKDELMNIGISNVNNAMLNIEISAFFIIPEVREYANEWYRRERDFWRIVVNNAVINKEIRNDIDVDTFVDIFVNAYLGTSFEGIVYENGYNINKLEKVFKQIYDLIKQ